MEQWNNVYFQVIISQTGKYFSTLISIYYLWTWTVQLQNKIVYINGLHQTTTLWLIEDFSVQKVTKGIFK